MKLLNIKQTNAAIANIKITGKALDQGIQEVGLSVLHHVCENREASLAIKLLNAMPKGGRRNALIEWFIQFGMIAVNMDKATAKERPLVFDRDRVTNLEGAAAKPWYTCRPERPAAEVFDVEAQLRQLMKRLENARAKGMEVKGDKYIAAMAKALAGEA